MHTCKDCEKCDVRDICPVYEIGGWLKEHENSVKIAVDEEIRKLASCCHIIWDRVGGGDSPTENQRKAIAAGIKGAFYLGFCKGRNYVEVPEVFNDNTRRRDKK